MPSQARKNSQRPLPGADISLPYVSIHAYSASRAPRNSTVRAAQISPRVVSPLSSARRGVGPCQ